MTIIFDAKDANVNVYDPLDDVKYIKQKHVKHEFSFLWQKTSNFFAPKNLYCNWKCVFHSHRGQFQKLKMNLCRLTLT